MGMDIVPQLTPPLSQWSHVRGDQAEQNCSDVPNPMIFFFHKNTLRTINHDGYMFTCTPLSQPITLIQSPYAREQIFVWETL